MEREAKLQELETKAPSESKEVESNIVRLIFGEDDERHPSPKKAASAARGDVVRIKGKACVVLRKGVVERQGRTAPTLTVLDEIDGVIFERSYFVEDVS